MAIGFWQEKMLTTEKCICLLYTSIVMLIAVLFSAPLNGCRRWLRIGFTIQVSEIAKFEMILLPDHLAEKAPHLEKLDPAAGRRVPRCV